VSDSVDAAAVSATPWFIQRLVSLRA